MSLHGAIYEDYTDAIASYENRTDTQMELLCTRKKNWCILRVFWPEAQGSHIDGSRVVSSESLWNWNILLDHKKDHSRYEFQCYNNEIEKF